MLGKDPGRVDRCPVCEFKFIGPTISLPGEDRLLVVFSPPTSGHGGALSVPRSETGVSLFQSLAFQFSENIPQGVWGHVFTFWKTLAAPTTLWPSLHMGVGGASQVLTERLLVLLGWWDSGDLWPVCGTPWRPRTSSWARTVLSVNLS